MKFSEKELKAFHLLIANNVKNIRKDKNISQLELALTLSIGHKSVSTIGKIEAYLENKYFKLIKAKEV